MSSRGFNHVGTTINETPTSATIIGYLAEIGQELNVADYPRLFAQIGYAFCDDLVFTKDTNTIIHMNSYTTNTENIPGYTVNYSTNYDASTYPAWKAFSGDFSSYVWLTGNGYPMNQWSQLSFPSPKFIYALGISGGSIHHLNTVSYGWFSGNGNRLLEINNSQYVGVAGAGFAAGQEVIKSLATPVSVSDIKLDIYASCYSVARYTAASCKIYSNVFTSFYLKDHIYNTGDEVKCQAFGGSLHTGLAENTSYYTRKVDADHYTLHPTANDATNNTNQITPTVVSSVPCKIYKVGKFKLKDSRNGILTNFIKY